jgi:hypothetical protein
MEVTCRKPFPPQLTVGLDCIKDAHEKVTLGCIFIPRATTIFMSILYTIETPQKAGTLTEKSLDHFEDRQVFRDLMRVSTL